MMNNALHTHQNFIGNEAAGVSRRGSEKYMQMQGRYNTTCTIMAVINTAGSRESDSVLLTFESVENRKISTSIMEYT